MSKIVTSKNGYYLQQKDGSFYGPFHSLAEAELNRFSPPHSKHLERLENYKFLKNV
jgi:hypothetical protein